MALLAPISADHPDVPTGLPGIPRVSWGTHLCQFYRTAEDLASTLVPFFAAGLANRERCLWITADPFRAADAATALGRAVPDLEARLADGQIEIIDFDAWYVRHAQLTTDAVLAEWLEREAAALRDGYRGLRLTGNTSWVRRGDWLAFAEYERRVHAAFRQRRVVAVCSYSLARCTTDDVLDVVRHHGMALARRDGDWALIRSATETLAAVNEPAAAAEHDAVVYGEGDFPAERVARFVADGLAAGEAVVLVACEDHAASVRAALARSGVDADGATGAGRLVWLDAARTLSSLMPGGAVDAERFAALVVPVLEGLRARFGAVRLFGEMVDLLARRGDFGAALALEGLWNATLAECPAALLCAYDGAAFAGADRHGRIADLADEHRRLHTVEPAAHAATLRGLVSELAEKTRALEAETSRRFAAESERDHWKAASRDASSHLSRLQRVTSALLAARSAADLGAVVVTTMAQAAGATSALLASARTEGALELEAHAGCPAAAREGPGLFALAPGSPLDDVFRSGRPAVLRTPEAIAARWPGADRRGVAAYVALPLEAGGARRGAVAFGFEAPRAFSTADQALFDDLARQAALSLERAQLLEDVEQARERAEDASRAKDEFLAMLGHELRNPLSPMLAVLHLMERRAPEAFREERAVLERQLRHMQALVDDLLDVSRIVRGKLTLRPQRLELSRVVAEALESAGPLLEARGHRVHVDVPAAGLAVLGDAHRLVQVVVNLLTNAAKYTPRGGSVSIAAEARGATAALRVVDDGDGIEPALASRVFDLFVQGPRGIARSEGGLGLGLAITRSIVERHGGTIRVQSDGAGKGSTFVVELPLATGSSAAEAPAPGPRRRPPGARRVLVVDDNEDAAETLADVLRCAGHDVRTAHDPAEALGAAERFAPEVIVVDIGLPSMDGWVLGERLRRLQPSSPPHCIAVTGYGMETDRERSRAAGFVAHLVKPLDLEQLDRVLSGLAAADDGGRDAR